MSRVDRSGQQSQQSLPSYDSVNGDSNAYGYIGSVGYRSSQLQAIDRLSGSLRSAVNNSCIREQLPDWHRGQTDVENNPTLVVAAAQLASRAVKEATDCAIELGMAPENIKKAYNSLDAYAEQRTDGTGNIKLSVASTQFSYTGGTSPNVDYDGNWSCEQVIQGVPYTDPVNRNTILEQEYKSRPSTATRLSNDASTDIEIAQGNVLSSMWLAGRTMTEAEGASNSRDWSCLGDNVKATPQFQSAVYWDLTSVLEQTKHSEVGGHGRLNQLEYRLVSNPEHITPLRDGSWTFGRKSVGLELTSELGYIRNCPPMEPLWISDYVEPDMNDSKYVVG